MRLPKLSLKMLLRYLLNRLKKKKTQTNNPLTLGTAYSALCLLKKNNIRITNKVNVMCKGEYQLLIILNRMTHGIINLLSESYVHKKKKSLGSGVRTFLVKMVLARNAVAIILNLFMNSGIPSVSNFEWERLFQKPI